MDDGQSPRLQRPREALEKESNMRTTRGKIPGYREGIGKRIVAIVHGISREGIGRTATFDLTVKVGASPQQYGAAVESFYRQQRRDREPVLIEVYEAANVPCPKINNEEQLIAFQKRHAASRIFSEGGIPDIVIVDCDGSTS